MIRNISKGQAAFGRTASLIGRKGVSLYAIALAAVIGLGLAGCETPLTKDDVKGAVREELVGLGGSGSGSDSSLESELEDGLRGGGYTVSVSGNDYTVIDEGSQKASLSYSFYSGGSGASIMQFINVYNSTSSDSYFVELKVKSADSGYTADPSGGFPISYTTATAPLNGSKQVVFDYQIFNAEDPIRTSVVKRGTITLKAAPTEAGVAKSLAASFENDLSSALNYYATDKWTSKAAASWGQTDAAYACTVVRGVSNTYINLPSLSDYTLTWGTAAASPSSLAGYTRSGDQLTFETTLAAGTVTVPFTLSSSLVSGKTIKGNLVVTTKAAL